MSLGFLFDEHVPPFLLRQLNRRAANTRVFIVGDEYSLPQGTADPDILLWVEANHCLLVTNNRAIMPGHLADHLAAGRHVPGIVQLPYPFEIGAVLEGLLLIFRGGSTRRIARSNHLLAAQINYKKNVPLHTRRSKFLCRKN